jgi:hypothetical protein
VTPLFKFTVGNSRCKESLKWTKLSTEVYCLGIGEAECEIRETLKIQEEHQMEVPV